MLRLSSLGVLMGSLYGKLTSSDSMVHHYVDNNDCDNLQPSFNTTEPDQKVRICYMKISMLIKLNPFHSGYIIIEFFVNVASFQARK